MWIEGTIPLYNYCDYLVNLLFLEESRAATQEIIKEHQIQKLRIADGADTRGRYGKVRRKAETLRGEKIDPGVKWLNDPYLSEVTLDDFARVKRFRKERLDRKAEVRAEHGKLLTDFFLENGYEKKRTGSHGIRACEKRKVFITSWPTGKPSFVRGIFWPVPTRPTPYSDW